MALRIGGVPKPLVEEEIIPQEEALPAEDLMAELPPSLDEEPVTEAGGDVPPDQVHYKTGQQRMAEACENCKYYIPEGACQIVSGEIDPEGICNIWVSSGELEGEPMSEGEPYPMEEEQVSEAVDVTQEGY